MIKTILENCSEAELGNILGWEILEFAKEITDNQLDIKNLSNAVFLTIGIDLIKNNVYRDLIISRMTVPQVEKVFTEFNKEINVSDYDLAQKYSGLKSLAKKYTKQFSTIMGMAEQWEAAEMASVPTVDVTSINPDYPLYDYQVVISNKATTLINGDAINRALMHLPTGAGKTRTALNVVCEHLRSNQNGLVVWLADSEELCGQALEEFSIAWSKLGNRGIKSYSFFSDSAKSMSGVTDGFLVAGLQRLNSLKKTERSFLFDKLQSKVTLIIFDEAHKALAPTYMTILNELSSNSEEKAFILGLTATPGRVFSQDENTENVKLAELFSSTKITMKVKGYESPVKYLIENEYLAHPNFYPINYEKKIDFDNESSDLTESNLMEKLSTHENRNLSIVRQAIKEYENGSTIIIFACGVDNSRELAATLCCLGYAASSLDSKNDTTESRRAKISEFKNGKLKIIVNYGVLTAGFDAPKTNVAIIGRPTNSLVLYSQMMGRAMRGKKSGGNLECNIYTVIDDIPEYMNLSNAFEYWDQSWSEI
ncbi:MAG: DEAD/DEAH box helicase [Chlorobi bacterium]|nr:DEAD/DEAH box helicase [Chlorobiota bacterium]